MKELEKINTQKDSGHEEAGQELKYQYFDISSIIRSLNISDKTMEKGMELLEIGRAHV